MFSKSLYHFTLTQKMKKIGSSASRAQTVVVPQSQWPRFFGVRPGAFDGNIVRAERLNDREHKKLTEFGFQFVQRGVGEGVLIPPGGCDILKVPKPLYQARMNMARQLQKKRAEARQRKAKAKKVRPRPRR